ncbi:MAG: peptidoglycan-binding protein [Rhodobacteraceae bacterium]|nr:peptidoglycan-binding protein [Paracoccaceae bacterium]
MRLNPLLLIAMLSVGIPQPAGTDMPQTYRAVVLQADADTTAQGVRDCWARYAVGGGQPQNGMLEEIAFRVPCPEMLTSGFIRNLQGALAVRDHYNGEVTGQPDAATRAAIRAYQRANGFDSPVLTVKTAQRLGLMP